MNIKINNKIYNVEIIYKNNKNMYLRIKDDLKIVVTAPLKISEKKICWKQHRLYLKSNYPKRRSLSKKTGQISVSRKALWYLLHKWKKNLSWRWKSLNRKKRKYW